MAYYLDRPYVGCKGRRPRQYVARSQRLQKL